MRNRLTEHALRAGITTFCSIVATLSLWATAAGAAEGVGEVELVRAALDGPVLMAERTAALARAEAAGTATRRLPNPTVEGRREQANGPAGASTDVFGGTLTLDLGAAGLAERRAAALRGEASEARHEAHAVDAICAVRASALDLWLAGQRVEVVARTHERLSEVADSLDAMATVGEVAGYDRDRAALAVAAHAVVLDAGAGELLGAQSGLSALVGRPVVEVTLAPLTPLEALQGSVADALVADPELAALRREREAAARAMSAARRAAMPDLVLSGGGRWDAMPDGSERTPGYEIGAGLELPLFDRNQAAVAEAKAELAMLDAQLAQREAEVTARVEAAWRQLERLGPIPERASGATIWDGALDRYTGGESSIDELLTVAGDVEAAGLASLEAATLRRRARLELSCAVGAFPEPELQALLEESLR